MSTTCPLCIYNDAKTELLSSPSKATSVTIPDSVVTIFGADEEHNAFFSSKDTLISFSFEKEPQLQTIQQYAFYSCKKLEKIDLSLCTKLTTISTAAFQYCSSVTELRLPYGAKLTTIDDYAFYSNSFTDLIIPNTITFIGINAFAYNTQLSNLTFEEGTKIQKIPKWLLAGCSSMKSFNIPASVTSLATFAEGNINIEKFVVEKGNKAQRRDSAAAGPAVRHRPADRLLQLLPGAAAPRRRRAGCGRLVAPQSGAAV